MERVPELYRRAQQPVDRLLLENGWAEMKVGYHVSAPYWSRIPAAGPVVVTACHPFGLLDGAILGMLLMQVRPDVKILTNSLLSGIPELHEYYIFVVVCGSSHAAGMNRSALRRAIFWLPAGVDRNFSDVLDGLVLVDLRRTDPTALERYMGKDGVQGFQRYHGLRVPPGVA